MSNAREQYAKSLIKQQHHDFLCPKPHQPVYRVPEDSVRVGIIDAMAAGLYAGLIIDSLADPRIT